VILSAQTVRSQAAVDD